MRGDAVAMGYLRQDDVPIEEMIAAGGFALDIVGEAFAATAALTPPHDPKGEKSRDRAQDT